MRQLFFILTLSSLVICSCDIPEPDIDQRLKYQKASIDTLFNHHQDSLEVFVKLTDKNELIPFKDSVLPDETEASFYILRDSLGRIAEITESPYSQSGDWYITLTHYFDNDGKTFAFVRQSNFFNSGCTEDVAYETKTEYYNSDFKLIGKDYQLTDEKGKDLRKDSCAFLYEYAYKVLPNLDKYIKVNHLPDSGSQRFTGGRNR